MNVCWLILWVILEYLESQENICSHVPVSTCQLTFICMHQLVLKVLGCSYNNCKQLTYGSF